MNIELWGIIAYLILQLALGIWFSRKSRNETDYYLAGRNLSPLLATGSIAATWFGAETCLGSSGMVYGSGLSGGRADPFGYTICLLLMAVFLSGRLWNGGYITLGDLFRQRYGARVETLAVLLMIPTSLLWAGAQIRAFGQIVSVSSSAGFEHGAMIATVVVVAYSAMGGLRADVLTDLVQGIGIALGLGILAFVCISQLGGIERAFATIGPERLQMLPVNESWLSQLDGWMIPILGSLVAQELITRVCASRTAVIARRAGLFASGIYLLVGLIPVGLALIGPAILPGLESHEEFLPALAREQLPTLLFILFAGAIISAILSTVDSALLAVGSLVSHNLIPRNAPARTDRQKLLVARVCVVIAGILAYVIAVTSESIHSLVESASGFGSSGILIITLFGLFSQFGHIAAGLAALAAGVIAIVIAEHILRIEAPFLVSIVSALIAYVVVALVEKRIAKSTVPGTNPPPA